MASTVIAPAPIGSAIEGRRSRVEASAADAPRLDAFPHTRRPLPWVLAAFTVMVFLVPIDETTLKINLPFSAEIDRLAVVLMMFAWFWFGGDQRTFMRSPRSKLYAAAAAAFLAAAVASLLFDAPRVINLGEWTVAQKQFALLASFLAVGWFALTALRTEDVHGFATLLIVLGTIVGLGILIERRTGYNIFYAVSGKLLSPIAHVSPPSTTTDLALSDDDRLTIVGPTATGLAAAAMLVMIMPFALVRLLNATTRKSWRLYALAVVIMLSAAIATDKKSSLVGPAIVLCYIAVHYPRKMLRLAPLGVVLFVVVHAAAPGALGTVLDPAQWFGSNSTVHRQGDLAAIMPDVRAHPLLGRGWGSVDVTQADQFRILDNQLFSMLWQTGVIGLTAYVAMLAAPIIIVERKLRSLRASNPLLAVAALGAAACCLEFLISNYIFDTLSFTQTPYIFFIVAAMCVAASGRTEPLVERRRVRIGAPAAGPAPAR